MTTEKASGGLWRTLTLSKKGKEIRAKKQKEADEKAALAATKRKRLDHL